MTNIMPPSGTTSIRFTQPSHELPATKLNHSNKLNLFPKCMVPNITHNKKLANLRKKKTTVISTLSICFRKVLTGRINSNH